MSAVVLLRRSLAQAAGRRQALAIGTGSGSGTTTTTMPACPSLTATKVATTTQRYFGHSLRTFHPPSCRASVACTAALQPAGADAIQRFPYTRNHIQPVAGLGAVRHFHSTIARREQASSKIEETVKAIQERGKEEQQLQQQPAKAASTAAAFATPGTTTAAAAAAAAAAPTEVTKVVAKKSIATKVWEEVVHYYHGFRLLFIDINVSRKLLWKTLRGNPLTRREYMLLIRTTGDTFRLLPFSVFIIVPFMELLLPVFIKFFPGMLPSTFETAKDMEDKARQNLKVKLEMAKFLQKTLDEMDVSNKTHSSDKAREFTEFFTRLRTAGERATPEEIMRFSKLFEDEITLDSLSRPQLAAICQVLEVPSYGTSAVLRFQLRLKLRSLAADDRMIQKEGVDTLSLAELQAASRARGMRSYGLSMGQLRHQIAEWIHLSLNEKVPPSLLLLSRAMMLPEGVTTAEKLKASMTVLSDSARIQTKAAIGEREGKIDNKTKIEIIRDEQRKIQEELDEQKQVEQEKADVLVDNAKVLSTQAPQAGRAAVDASAAAVAAATAASAKSKTLDGLVGCPAEGEPASLTAKDIEVVSDAIGQIGADKKSLLVEKEEIKDLKEEIAEYKEDVEELKEISKTVEKPTITESVASKNLLKKVDSMIGKLDKALAELEEKEAKLRSIQQADEKPTEELVRIDEIMTAIRKMQKVPDNDKVKQIEKMLGRIDNDKDGNLKVDDVLRIMEEIGKESVALNEKQVDELMDLITKEEKIENEQKIEKALAKQQAAAVQQSNDDAAEQLHDLNVKIVKASADTEELTDTKTKVLQDGEDDAKEKHKSKIHERINTAVIRSADELAERQLKNIPPPATRAPSTSTPAAPASSLTNGAPRTTTTTTTQKAASNDAENSKNMR